MSYDLFSRAERVTVAHEGTHLLNSLPDHVTRHVDLILLPEPNGACNSLALHGRVPLKLDDEDAVGTSEVEPGESQ